MPPPDLRATAAAIDHVPRETIHGSVAGLGGLCVALEGFGPLAAIGDRVRLRCGWDNSAENQPAPGGVRQPPRDVTYGEKTSDEMCIGTLALLDLGF